MGLDQYAYVAESTKQREKFSEGAVWDEVEREYVNPNVAKPEELAYWRKHPNLQGWMEKLFLEKGGKCKMFNGVELELTWEDVDRLEKDIKAGELSKLDTKGFFFGSPSDDYYKEQDLQFCVDAKAELFLKRRVFYNSSW